jgi:phenylalanyl-tRNA synthetase alpha chain
MFEEVDQIVTEALAVLASVERVPDLEQTKARFLGKNGTLSALLKRLGTLPQELRPQAGARINHAKDEIEDAFKRQRERIASRELERQLAAEALDVTLPGRTLGQGSLHPLTQTIERVKDLFHSVGFDVADGPEIETDFYNFTALNFPEDHPARAMHDTFFIDDEHLLRTHTSPVQIRYMQAHRPPLRVIAPGRVYRFDSVDLTHSPMFHQVEGLWVDQDVSFAGLKGLLIDFMQRFFEQKDLRARFRPSFFPFTEPSAEMDIGCVSCLGKGCRVCSQTGWLEVLGCGMVHPKVLENVGIDPENYPSFAFGLGVERLAMLRYGINDMRMFFENDLRFLRQFGS